MKKKKKNPTQNEQSGNKRFQPHFRKFHSKETTGHPTYVYGNDGKAYKVIGITKSSKTNDILNIQLDKNPEPENNSPAYIRPKPIKVPNGTKSVKLKGWKFANSDKPKVQGVINKENNKKKPRKK